jgi:HSP20 family protein
MAAITRFTPPLMPSFTEPDPFNTVLRRFFGDNLLEPQARQLGWMPNIEITETNDELLLTAELPGLDIKDVQLTIEDNVLTLRGEKQQDVKEGEEKKFHLFERFYGSFTRSFSLPRTVDTAKVVAEFEKGVLKVKMPKAPNAKGKVVNIVAR